jgi:hypothetical protein
MLWSQADGLINIGSEETNIGILGLVFQDNKEATVYLDDLYSGKYSDSPQVPNRESLKKNVLFYRSSGITEKINFSSPYIQSRIYALKMLSWLSGFAAKEFIEIELSAFGVPHIQIGDIVTIDYDIPNLVESVRRQKDIVSPLGDNFETPTIAFLNNGDRFMVKSISVNRDVNGPEYKLNLAQLPDIATWNAGDF